MPRTLRLDNGTQFQEKKIMEWCKDLNIKKNLTSVGNPQANGQTKVMNRTILQNFKKRLDGSKMEWVDELLGVGMGDQKLIGLVVFHQQSLSNNIGLMNTRTIHQDGNVFHCAYH
ncbi:UNVERIFIED_CONTAM: hypothetical protein Scaly_2851400 [Sesamum calycinum]|uniref:Integrase catalytic domain-containing protein n=1 Tax=Sesamum calycinum TaxID=2727403 RepID=A0AAW2LKI3_9LAMI